MNVVTLPCYSFSKPEREFWEIRARWTRSADVSGEKKWQYRFGTEKDVEEEKSKSEVNYLKATYGLIAGIPQVTTRILILDWLDYKLTTVASYCYGRILRDIGWKLGHLDVCFIMKGAVPKVETVAKLFDGTK